MKSPKHVFIVDDDIDDRDLFIEAVDQIDPSIVCKSAQDGQEALQKLNESNGALPDIIFLDLNMPRINGKQCLEQLKNTDHLKHIPVAIYSTSSFQKDIDETRQLGAEYFITKPANFRELCSVIAQVIAPQQPR